MIPPGFGLRFFPWGDPLAEMHSAHYKTPAALAIPIGMRPEEREHMYRLCRLIEKEQDPDRFSALIKELNELLERKEQRLEDRPDTKMPDA